MRFAAYLGGHVEQERSEYAALTCGRINQIYALAEVIVAYSARVIGNADFTAYIFCVTAKLLGVFGVVLFIAQGGGGDTRGRKLSEKNAVRVSNLAKDDLEIGNGSVAFVGYLNAEAARMRRKGGGQRGYQ